MNVLGIFITTKHKEYNDLCIIQKAHKVKKLRALRFLVVNSYALLPDLRENNVRNFLRRS
jgi:hypothetical protein